MLDSIIAFGTFDIIHPGHLAYLAYAASKAERLVVVVTPDAAVVRRKGSPPIFSQSDRLRMVGSLKGVWKAVLGDKDDSWARVKRLRPSAACFGYDQDNAMEVFTRDVVNRARRSIRLFRAPSYHPALYHSTYYRSS